MWAVRGHGEAEESLLVLGEGAPGMAEMTDWSPLLEKKSRDDSF